MDVHSLATGGQLFKPTLKVVTTGALECGVMSWHQATFLPVTEGELGAAGQMLLQRIINMHKRHNAVPGQLEQLLLAMGVEIVKVADQKDRAARLGDAPGAGEPHSK